MKFLLDENIGKEIANFLRQLGHTTFRIKEINPGIPDFQVLDLAVSKEAILITSDKDFGELVFKYGQSHRGIILLRLEDETSGNKILALKKVISRYKKISDFIVVTEKAGKFTIRKRVSLLQ